MCSIANYSILHVFILCPCLMNCGGGGSPFGTQIEAKVSNSVINRHHKIRACINSEMSLPFGGDKVSILIHTNPPLRKINAAICNCQVDTTF